MLRWLSSCRYNSHVKLARNNCAKKSSGENKLVNKNKSRNVKLK